MLTDTQAGSGPSLSGLSLKNGKPAYGSVAEANSESQGVFAAILAETDSETVGAGVPKLPDAEEKRSEPASSETGRTPAGKEGSVSSRGPDIKHIDAGGADEGRLRQETTATPADDTGIWEGQLPEPRETPHPATTGKGIAGHALMSVNGAGADGPEGAHQSFFRDIGTRVRLPASPADATVSAKPGVDESHGETKAAQVAERPLRAGVGPLSVPTSGVSSWPERAAAAHGPSAPLSAIAPTSAGAAEIAPRDAKLVPGLLSRSGSGFALPSPSTPESEKRSGEGTGPGRPNGSAMTQAVSLPGVTYSGPTPVMGGSGLSFFGPLPRSEHVQTSDGGPTVPDARFSGYHASASLSAPAATYRHDLPQQIVVQIAAAAEKGKTGPQKNIDLSLNPEELGRVRLRLSPSEGGLNVLIVAERSETLDLLRRNIDMLAREFLEIGYEGASFDFAGGRQEQADANASTSLRPVSDVPGATPAVQTGETHVLALGDRLDIRL